jgi:hypothetical protein
MLNVLPRAAPAENVFHVVVAGKASRSMKPAPSITSKASPARRSLHRCAVPC